MLCSVCGTQYYDKAGRVTKCPDEKCDADVGFEAAVRLVAESGAACAAMHHVGERRNTRWQLQERAPNGAACNATRRAWHE